RDRDVEQPNSVGEAPTFVAIEGVENPLQIPLFLLSLDEIEEAMALVAPTVVGPSKMTEEQAKRARDTAIATLLRTPVPMFAKKDRKTLRALGGVDAPEIPVMRENAGVREIRWDPNRILWERLDPASNADVLQALALVIAAVDYCSTNEGEGPRARRMVLSRGDLLIVDNQRTLICRREADFYGERRRLKLAAGLPPQWWLRGFYGFRSTQGGESARRKRQSADYGARAPGPAPRH
ncbi:MAG: hypothetical protein K2Q06_06070, partial [Parvularculaceae bacterium]|nr:hypothetical protein [Parvularculaceae bacterium]